MQLVTSLTVDASLLVKLLRLWDEGGDTRNPFSNVLVTPLFANHKTLSIIKHEIKEKRGANVFFDSGGYYAQQGKITFEDLYRALRDYYLDVENRWADYYVLPDDVPTSADSLEQVQQKVSNTITAAKMFFAEMPLYIKEKAIPVIQGHTLTQISTCIDTYFDLGLSYFGFGSFGTNGVNSSINVADSRSASNVSVITSELNKRKIKLHVFGVSTPPVIYAFKKLGVNSFDSLAWQRSAGFGKVYLPFTRAYNVSHRSTKNSALNEEEFNHIKEITGHTCPFCEKFIDLSQNRLYRSLHNLASVMDTIEATPKIADQSIASLIEWKSNHYYKLFEDVYRG
jgi:queuine/archaeosine tRNA-ribosyltransferase